ncbi:MAG: response regulator transcription factor [Kiritimatiellae bacterium]|nr:response regulator transcription factor [Kiritimatiellia bacterium]
MSGGTVSQLILVVEDEEAIRELIGINLQAAGCRVDFAVDGTQALEKVKTIHPDLILLDWMLPGLDGLDVLRRLKADSKLAVIPVMMLTAKSEESDIVLGLEMGAADYLTKPFSNKVLIARIRAILRREAPEPEEENIRYVGLTLTPGQRRAVLDKKEIVLTTGEFDLLALLCARPGHVYTRAQIVARVRGEGYPVTDRAVDVQIVALRRKLGTFGERLETVRGVGYRMRA